MKLLSAGLTSKHGKHMRTVPDKKRASERHAAIIVFSNITEIVIAFFKLKFH